MEIITEPFETTCQDGVVLRGKLIIPDQPKAVIQFNCGTGTQKEFYQHMLTYLAEHGYVCCLWDYRGNGESAPESLRACPYSFHEYGTLDMPAVKAYLKKRFPTLPFLIVGHSAGGQQIGLMDQVEDVDGLVAIAVSTGYGPGMPLSYRLQSLFFFYLFSPISVLLTGYVKAKPFNIMENLPRNVMREWRAWCSKKDYLFDSAFRGQTIPTGHFDHYPFPVSVYYAPDDNIGTEANCHSYWKHVQSERGIKIHKIIPAEYGLSAIGHFGFFRRKAKDTLWPLFLKDLDHMLSPQNT